LREIAARSRAAAPGSAQQPDGGTVSFDDERVRDLIRQLDAAVPRDGHLVVGPFREDEGTVVQADRLGYLRLGIELLKAAHAPTQADELLDEVDVDLGYLTGLEAHCYSFQRTESLVRPAAGGQGGVPGWVGVPTAGLIVVFILASLVVGALTILGWLARALL
jgi:hypothetical protein